MIFLILVGLSLYTWWHAKQQRSTAVTSTPGIPRTANRHEGDPENYRSGSQR